MQPGPDSLCMRLWVACGRIASAIVLGITLGGGPAAVFADPVEYRIIVIDNALYSGIADTDARHKALDHLLADVTMFEDAAHAATVETVVFMRGGPKGESIDEVFTQPAGDRVAPALSGTDEFRAMQNGTVRYDSGLDIQTLRSRIHDFLFGIDDGRVDIHIFAASWSSAHGSMRNMMTQDLPSNCVARDDPQPTLVPDDIEITVELRAPENQKKPSDAALANLITLIAGTSEQRPNVHSRGVAGPLCPMQDGAVAVSYSPNSNGSEPCVAVALSTAQAAYSACRAPLVPSKGPVDRSPVRLVAAGRDLSLNAAALRVLTPPAGVALQVKIAGLAVPAGGAVTLAGALPAGDYESWLMVTPDPACRPAAGARFQIDGQDGAGMQVATSRLSCVDARFRLSDIRVP